MLLLLVATNAVHIYNALDTGVTLAYQQDQFGSYDRDLAMLNALVASLAQSQSKQDMLVTLRRLDPDAFIVATDSTLSVGQLTFFYSSASKLDSVSRL
jgi:hypothetical protein